MIFVTLGTHEQPFNRLLELLLTLPQPTELVIQHGATRPMSRFEHATWIDYASPDEIRTYMQAAEAVISHAGVGSLVTAMHNGKKPVAVPRLASFGEHVDDHQLEIAERFAKAGLALKCLPGDSLAALVEESIAARVASPKPYPGLPQTIALAAWGLDTEPRSRERCRRPLLLRRTSRRSRVAD